ncbi:30S ribosomal protein S8 [Mesoplasma photuris]|uniref:30S ribosomal protein S8 n=1 Tax=Mesoplasma photuris TaxID=217731 RepID=UPI0004E27DED|nr:30S ribosomal protein S8 [Mesoplasma photuris]
MTTDVIADMLTRIRNANQRYLKTVSMPSSKMKIEIARILKEEGFISEFSIDGDVKKTITIELKYQGKTRVIQGLKKISKPGLRVYAPANEIPQVLNGLGIAIVSTSKGIMTDKQARKAQAGGEVLAFIW